MRTTVAKHLTDNEYQLLMNTHKNHTDTMKAAERAKHSLERITKVVRTSKVNCLNVHYGKTNWYHYTARGDWY